MPLDPLLDRNCVLLDGHCTCPRPVYDHCKYLVDKIHDELQFEKNKDGKCIPKR